MDDIAHVPEKDETTQDYYSEFTSRNKDKRNQVVFEVIQDKHPVTKDEIAKILFNEVPEQGSDMDRELNNALRSLQKENRVYNAKSSQRTEYKIDDGWPRSLDDVSGNGESGKYICVDCRLPKSVFESSRVAKNHRKETGHDNWTKAYIPEKWAGIQTVRRVIQRKLGELD